MNTFLKRIGFASVALATLVGCSNNDGDGKAKNNCVAACDVGLEDAAAKLPFQPAAPGDWTMFRADVRRTGYAPESTIGDNVEEVWRRENFMVRDWTAVKPSGAVWEDELYYPSDSGILYAFDRHDGTVIWETELIDRNPGIHGSPLATTSVVFLGTYAGNLHALDRTNGEEIWRYKIGNVIGSSPAYVEEENAIYISHEAPKSAPLPGAGYVTKNDPRTGEEIWASEKLHHWPHSSVGIDPDRKVVMVGANDGIIHAYDSDDGTELWQRDFESTFGGEADIKTTPAMSASRGYAIFGTWDRHVYALDARTGDEIWKYNAAGAMQGSAALDDENGVVYQGSPNGTSSVVALDLDTGEEIWTASLGGVSSSPALSGDRTRLITGTNDNRIVALDAATGDVIWEFTCDGPVSPTPIIVGDMIYVAARFGSLYALRTN